MKELKIYANYGVLAYEKETIYTAYAPEATATVSEEVTVYVPEGFEVGQNALGNILVDSDKLDFTYDLNEILGSNDDKPCFTWFDGHKNNGVMLRIKK